MAGTKLRIGRETRIEVSSRSGIWLDPALLLKQIARAGYEARRGDVLVRATGRLRRVGDRWTLALEQPGGAAREVALVGAPGPGWVEDAAVEVRGLWRPGDTLEVRELARSR